MGLRRGGGDEPPQMSPAVREALDAMAARMPERKKARDGKRHAKWLRRIDKAKREWESMTPTEWKAWTQTWHAEERRRNRAGVLPVVDALMYAIVTTTGADAVRMRRGVRDR